MLCLLSCQMILHMKWNNIRKLDVSQFSSHFLGFKNLKQTKGIIHIWLSYFVCCKPKRQRFVHFAEPFVIITRKQKKLTSSIAYHHFLLDSNQKCKYSNLFILKHWLNRVGSCTVMNGKDVLRLSSLCVRQTWPDATNIVREGGSSLRWWQHSGTSSVNIFTTPTANRSSSLTFALWRVTTTYSFKKNKRPWKKKLLVSFFPVHLLKWEITCFLV